MKFLYLCFTYLYVTPLAVAAVFMRLMGDKTQVERLGFGLPRVEGGKKAIWLVASSVGEVNIALKLTKRIKAITSQPVVLTVTTQTGRRFAHGSDSRADLICYHPFDIKSSVRRTLQAFRPYAIVLIETELWPVLMEEALASGVRLIQVSGRISEHSLSRYLAFKPLFQPLLQKCERLMMQSGEDAERISQIMADTSNVEVIGSIKGDYVPPEADRLGETNGYLHPWKDLQIITCGSTRPREEEVLLDAFVQLKQSFPRLRIVIAPRHLDRLPEVVNIIQQRKLSFCRRSTMQLDQEMTVLLLDTIGELNLFYHCSEIAFVGGTVAPLGGHNLLEPALAGCPVLFGPHYENQRDGRDSLLRHGLGFQVNNRSDICETISSILNDSGSKSRFACRAVTLRQENAAILDTYVTRIIGR